MDTSMYGIIVNSLSAHVAVLDEKGVIVKTNRAWREFGLQNGMEGRPDSIGVNYLDICEMAAADGEREGELVAIGIEKILSGELLEYVIQYPCHSPTRRRWFNLRLLPYLSEYEHWVLVVHEDVRTAAKPNGDLRHAAVFVARGVRHRNLVRVVHVNVFLRLRCYGTTWRRWLRRVLLP